MMEVRNTSGTRFALLAALAALIMLVSACTSSSQGPSASSSSTTKSGSTFVYDWYDVVMVGWDPSTAYSNEIIAMSNMYETLTRYDSVTKKVVPLLATSWSSSDDQKTWTYNLRHGVKFHTGRPMNAQAAKAAIERTIQLNQGAAYIWGGVTSIDTPTPYTLVFHLKYSSVFPLITSADYAAYIYDTHAVGNPADLAKWFGEGHDAGTGPYTVESWHSGQEIELTLKAFPGYWGGWAGDHYKTIVFRDVPQATTGALLAQSGQVTFVDQLTPQLWATFKGNPAFQTPVLTSWQNMWLMMNTQSGPLKNLDLRKAVAAAFDYNGFLAADKGVGVRTPGVAPPGLIGYNPNGPQYQYNPALARKYLAESGLHNVVLRLDYTSGDPNEQLAATLLKSDLAAIGVKVNVSGLLSTTEIATATGSNIAQRQDMTFLVWYPDYPDAYSWFVNLFKTRNPPVWNFSYYSNPTVDKQIGEIEVLLALNPAAGEQMYFNMQDEIFQDVPAINLYTLNNSRVLQAGVKGYADNPAYPNVVFVYTLTP